MATVMKFYEVPTKERYEGSLANEKWITRIFVGKNGAIKEGKDFGVMVQDVKAGGVPPGKALHYHANQETLFFILSGKCVVNVEGKEYELEPNSAIWIPQNEKHGLTKVLEDVKLLAIVSNPYHLSDHVESEQPWYQEYPSNK